MLSRGDKLCANFLQICSSIPHAFSIIVERWATRPGDPPA